MLLMIVQRKSPLLKLYPAPISFSFPVRERAVLHYKSKLHNYHINFIPLLTNFEENYFINLF